MAAKRSRRSGRLASSERAFDLVFMDVHMPWSTAWRRTRLIKELYAAQPDTACARRDRGR
jgi:CheY-like chemotaxis protein